MRTLAQPEGESSAIGGREPGAWACTELTHPTTRRSRGWVPGESGKAITRRRLVFFLAAFQAVIRTRIARTGAWAVVDLGVSGRLSVDAVTDAVVTLFPFRFS